MGRTVALVDKFARRLLDLTRLQEEVNGMFLYKPQSSYCGIESIFMTGIGTEGHVRAEPERIRILNAFFQRNPDYRIVKFHTHSRGTIEKHGDYYANHFSQGDIASYDELLREDPDFIGMVVTPKRMLLYAPDNPKIQVARGFPLEADARIRRDLQQIASEQGYNLSGFITRNK